MLAVFRVFLHNNRDSNVKKYNVVEIGVQSTTYVCQWATFVSLVFCSGFIFLNAIETIIC